MDYARTTRVMTLGPDNRWRDLVAEGTVKRADISAHYAKVLREEALVAVEQAAWNHHRAQQELAESEFGTARNQILVGNLLTAGQTLTISLTQAIRHGVTLEQIKAVPNIHPSYVEDVETGIIGGVRNF